jgi:hypothetical protein
MYFLMRLSQRISELAFQFEDLREARPITVRSQEAAHRDPARISASMAFLNCLSRAEIRWRGRPARPTRWQRKERLNVLIDLVAIVFDDPEVIAFGLG